MGFVNSKYVSGDFYEERQFPTLALYLEWDAHILEVKDIITIINAFPVQVRMRWYPFWLKEAEQFGHHWGNKGVPGDIKAAVHSVQKGLNLPLTPYD